MKLDVRLKRAYLPPSPDDGVRVLVDRLWPRGVRKSDAAIDRWLKEVAPSTELRRWFGHDPSRWEEFGRRYRVELSRDAALSMSFGRRRTERVSRLSTPRATRSTTKPSFCAICSSSESRRSLSGNAHSRAPRTAKSADRGHVSRSRHSGRDAGDRHAYRRACCS